MHAVYCISASCLILDHQTRCYSRAFLKEIFKFHCLLPRSLNWFLWQILRLQIFKMSLEELGERETQIYCRHNNNNNKITTSTTPLHSFGYTSKSLIISELYTSTNITTTTAIRRRRRERNWKQIQGTWQSCTGLAIVKSAGTVCYQSVVWGQTLICHTGDTYSFWCHDVILILQAFAWQLSVLKD